jgi:nitrogen fixation NifU-like protein
MLDQLYRQLVLEHYKHKRNFGSLDGEDIKKIHYKNPTCGDVMTLFLQMKDKTIQDISFQGEGCSISMASSSMMTDLIKRKNVQDISSLRMAFERLIRNGEFSDDCDLGDALSLQGVHKLRARHNCALMPWQALDKAMKDTEGYRGIK